MCTSTQFCTAVIPGIGQSISLFISHFSSALLFLLAFWVTKVAVCLVFVGLCGAVQDEFVKDLGGLPAINIIRA